MLKIGDKAPPFALPDEDGAIVELGNLLEKGPILLYFYPADFTPVCTRQACMYRDIGSQLVQRGIQVIGISRQDSESKARFSEAFGLGFVLLSDVSGATTRDYGAMVLGGLLVRRIAYVIEADGRISDRAESLFSLGKHQQLVQRLIQPPKP